MLYSQDSRFTKLYYYYFKREIVYIYYTLYHSVHTDSVVRTHLEKSIVLLGI